jgi:hypothetical protein
LAFGLVVSCGDDDDDDEMQLSVELEWANAVDMNLIITEPTGQEVGGNTTNGPTTVSVGDNTCGFGSTCDPGACTGSLTCGNRERIYASNVAIGGRYIISVQSIASSDENVTVFITVPESWVQSGNAYYLRVDCTVPPMDTWVVAYADFPAAGSTTIGAEVAEVGCTVTDQRFR